MALLTPPMLDDLTEAYHRLVADMRDAYETFRPNDEAGRQAVVRSLRAALRFLTSFPNVAAEDLVIPLGHLMKAVEELDDGVTNPLLRPSKKKSGRPKDSSAWDAFRGFVVYWLELAAKYEEGSNEGERFDAACGVACKVLNAARVSPTRGNGKFSVRTLRGWRETVSADIGLKTTAGQTLRGLQEKSSLIPPPRMPVHEQRTALRKVLKTMVIESKFGNPANP